MLADLPTEILQQIVGHLPTATSFVNLCLTCKSFYETLSADDYASFRFFVQKSFPSFSLPDNQNWRDLARSLTSLSRAFDRVGIVGRECYAPAHLTRHPRNARQTGYFPAIDSYCDYAQTNCLSGREVLVIGAEGRLFIRQSDIDSTTWGASETPEDHLPRNSILDVRLLRPNQKSLQNGESVVIRRLNNTIDRVDFTSDFKNSCLAASYSGSWSVVNCIDTSPAQDALLAVCDSDHLSIYPVYSNSDDVQVLPIAKTSHFATDNSPEYRMRFRSSRFLSETRLVASIEYLEGLEASPLQIYEITPDDIKIRQLPSAGRSISEGHSMYNFRRCASAFGKLDPAGSLAGRNGDVFLSGWTDGTVRLHDLRNPTLTVAEYLDSVDQGQILSLTAFGHEKFLAASIENACLKMYDMRMSGAKVYSYLQANSTANVPFQQSVSYNYNASSNHTSSNAQVTRNAHESQANRHRDIASSNADLSLKTIEKLARHLDRGINIFLSVRTSYGASLWSRLPPQRSSEMNGFNGGNPNHQGSGRNNRPHQRYTQSHQQQNRTRDNTRRSAGPLYALSSPSSISSKVYVGITGHVLELDFACTDDVLRAETNPSSYPAPKRSELDLSCYERPRPEHVMSDPVLLRSQLGYDEEVVTSWWQEVNNPLNRLWLEDNSDISKLSMNPKIPLSGQKHNHNASHIKAPTPDITVNKDRNTNSRRDSTSSHPHNNASTSTFALQLPNNTKNNVPQSIPFRIPSNIESQPSQSVNNHQHLSKNTSLYYYSPQINEKIYLDLGWDIRWQPPDTPSR